LDVATERVRPRSVWQYLRATAGLRSLAPAAPLAILLVGFFLIPLTVIVWDSFGGLALDFASYRRILTEPVYFTVLAHTFKVSAYVTLFSILLGYPVAYLLSSLKPRTAIVVSTFLLIPLFTAFLIRTYAWMVILGRQGIVNNTLIWLGFVDEPIQILNTTTAVVIGMVHVLAPIGIFTMYAVMAQIDRRLVAAAQVLGANPVRTFLRVYLPMSLPGVFAAATLVLIMAIGFYITPALLGGPADTMISQLIVVQTTTLLNFPLGYASATILLLATLAILFLASLFIPLEMMWSAHEAQPGTGGSRIRPTGARLVRRALGAGLSPVFRVVENATFRLVGPLMSERRIWQWVFTATMLVFFVAPVIVIVILSFSSSPFVTFPPPGFSLQWYEKLYRAADWHAALVASLQIGGAAVAIGLVAGTAGAFALVRSPLRGKRALFLLSLSPIVIPVIVLALALYIYEARLGLLGSYVGLVIGHAVLATPYVVVVMASAVRGFDRTLEHAASVHGARPATILRRVTLPILKPALTTAGLLAFLISFDELLVTIFLLGRLPQTLPIKFWNDIKYQFDPLLSAASTVIILAVVFAVGISQWLRLRRIKRRAVLGNGQEKTA
jgi:ABC-type spermidine/putrescine transport system permease subunit I